MQVQFYFMNFFWQTHVYILYTTQVPVFTLEGGASEPTFTKYFK